MIEHELKAKALDAKAYLAKLDANRTTYQRVLDKYKYEIIKLVYARRLSTHDLFRFVNGSLRGLKIVDGLLLKTLEGLLELQSWDPSSKACTAYRYTFDKHASEDEKFIFRYIEDNYIKLELIPTINDEKLTLYQNRSITLQEYLSSITKLDP